MFGLGILVGAALFGTGLLWYRGPNGRFSTRILGYDLGAPPPRSSAFLRTAPRATIQLIRAWQTPISDPEAERDRLLMTHRFRILVALLVLFGVIPFFFELVGLVAPLFVAGGAIGTVVFVGALAGFAERCVAIARPVVAYGNGERLDRRALTSASAGAIGIALVLAIVLAVSSE